MAKNLKAKFKLMQVIKLQALYFVLIIISLISCGKKMNTVSTASPNGQILFRLMVENGKPFYQVEAHDNIVIAKSGLGMEFKNLATLKNNLSIANFTTKSFNEIWEPIYGTSSQVTNRYNETVIDFVENSLLNRSFSIIVRVYDDGVAFRYSFPEWSVESPLLIVEEITHFNFLEDHNAWWIPADEFAYESLYRKTPISQMGHAKTPVTIETTCGLFLSIHEAQLLNYSEFSLKKNPEKNLSFTTALWPEPDGVCARVELPFQTPWRSIHITQSAGELVESNLIQNLNEPSKIDNTSWIQPMKFIGIWWGMHIGKYTWHIGPNHGATTQRAKQYIDFAAKHGIEGVLVEGWNLGWETWTSEDENVQDFSTPYPNFDLEAVVKYAQERNVDFVSHHETGSNIPLYEEQLHDAFALCKRLGIRALKTGYAGPIIPEGYHHHSQFMVNHFQRVVETAAQYGIMLNVHEGIKPTGLERTWPNLLTTEAIRGNEWNATYRATPPYHSTILPFTRFLAGPADYTPGIFNIIHSPEANKRLFTTLAHQLAHFVVFYSPMKMVSDLIENYQNQPAFQFIIDVPATWNQTKVIGAKLGSFACIARRSGDDWFVGSVANEECHLVDIPLSFLSDGIIYKATIYGDDLRTDWETRPTVIEIGNYLVTSSDTIRAALSKAGGNAIRICPVDDISTLNLTPIEEYNRNADNKMDAFQQLRTYGKWEVVHKAIGKPVKLGNPYSPKYPSTGSNALTDGKRGRYNHTDAAWQGYRGVNLDATIDLHREKSIQRIAVGFMNSPNDWIFYPSLVEFFVSDNGINFTKIGEQRHITKKPVNITEVHLKDFEISFSPRQTKHIRVKAYNLGICPPWHYAAGNEAWIFVDEILID